MYLNDRIKACLVFGDLDLIFEVIVLHVIKTSRWSFWQFAYGDKLKSCIMFDYLDPICKVNGTLSSVCQEYIS